jgi:hypothetical protein
MRSKLTAFALSSIFAPFTSHAQEPSPFPKKLAPTSYLAFALNELLPYDLASPHRNTEVKKGFIASEGGVSGFVITCTTDVKGAGRGRSPVEFLFAGCLIEKAPKIPDGVAPVTLESLFIQSL